MLKTTAEIQKIAQNTIRNEADAIADLIPLVDEQFAEVVKLILEMKGRLIISGIGKSAIIANKIVATLNSTGTPAVFMHAADAIHGDLGTIQAHDMVICISKSGETPEIKVLVPLIRSFGNVLVALVGNTNSFLAKQADFVLNASVSREACPNNLAPTASTTAQLVVGDALAVALLECRGFSASDFGKYHPGGALGKQLYLKVKDLAANNEKPSVEKNCSINEVILEISGKRLGATAVIQNHKIIGVITDGDLRRMMQQKVNPDNICAQDIMGKNPKTIQENEMAVNALERMRENNITQLLVVDEQQHYAGVVHLHDLLREGIL